MNPMADVTVREVGLRDGLQLVKTVIATEIKLDWCRQQADCGFNEIEVTSFVPPTIIPQFADAAEVLSGAHNIPNLRAAVLVPNLKGAIRALDAGAEKITFVLSASEAHNQSNVRCSTQDSISAFRDLVAERNLRGLQDTTQLSCVIATSFGCSIQGDVPEGLIHELTDILLESGADELSYADTVGYGNPVQVKRILGEVMSNAGDTTIAAHFHDTRGMGLANVVAAVDAGVRQFDASLGGLGGCPFAPGATGNIATEDCVYLLETIGLSTGIDLELLLNLRKMLANWLPEENINGCLNQAGLARNFTAN